MSGAHADIKARWDDPAAHTGNYPPDWDARRRAVYERDDWTCTRCGRRSGPYAGDDGVPLHAHHLTPRSAGGTHRLSNLTTLCEPCHADLHGHDLFEPTEPTHRPATRPVLPRVLGYLGLAGFSVGVGSLVYLWAIVQLASLSVTWQTAIAGGVLLAIAAASYHVPKLVGASSLAAGLLIGGLAYEVAGVSPVRAGILLAVLWLPGAIAGVRAMIGPMLRTHLLTT